MVETGGGKERSEGRTGREVVEKEDRGKDRIRRGGNGEGGNNPE